VGQRVYENLQFMDVEGAVLIYVGERKLQFQEFENLCFRDATCISLGLRQLIVLHKLTLLTMAAGPSGLHCASISLAAAASHRVTPGPRARTVAVAF
jgi:hypothetical protein